MNLKRWENSMFCSRNATILARIFNVYFNVLVED